ncbi:hypothetical protein BS47DRAFT_1362560 [Hydnum rufescens UP504]|uniref:Uncharacterized protein n=1 Tax=Hydnum rufescens UP504 TaxID=1448309 RepID=A0A9P6AWK3_9AGAM|nr:hypothetical protein BS47DRAFT_1362560 [Hydnum rufescens UP504]
MFPNTTKQPGNLQSPAKSQMAQILSPISAYTLSPMLRCLLRMLHLIFGLWHTLWEEYFTGTPEDSNWIIGLDANNWESEGAWIFPAPGVGKNMAVVPISASTIPSTENTLRWISNVPGGDRAQRRIGVILEMIKGLNGESAHNGNAQDLHTLQRFEYCIQYLAELLKPFVMMDQHQISLFLHAEVLMLGSISERLCAVHLVSAVSVKHDDIDILFFGSPTSDILLRRSFLVVTIWVGRGANVLFVKYVWLMALYMATNATLGLLIVGGTSTFIETAPDLKGLGTVTFATTMEALDEGDEHSYVESRDSLRTGEDTLPMTHFSGEMTDLDYVCSHCFPVAFHTSSGAEAIRPIAERHLLSGVKNKRALPSQTPALPPGAMTRNG